MTFDFSGKRAFITGAGSGIGAATAHWLAEHGVDHLVLVDRDEAALAALDLVCRTSVILGDVSDPALASRIEQAGPYDCAVINAGIASGTTITELDFDDWRRVMAVNLDGAFLTLQAAMRAIPQAGSVVVTASVSGIKAEPGTAAYAASKAAVIQLAKVAAKEGAPRGLRVTAIAPGGVDTPMWDQAPFFADLVRDHGGDRDAAIQAMAKMATPLGRFASADEIAAQIGFLLSDAAATITGTVMVSDGGYAL